MRTKSVFLYIITLLCFTAPFAFGQSAPFFIEGKYAQSAPVSGVSERQKADLLENTLTEMEIAFDSQDYDRVITLSDSLIKEDCTDYRLYVYQALAYEQLDDCKNAEYFATKAINLAPSAVDPYVVRANCAFKNKKETFLF